MTVALFCQTKGINATVADRRYKSNCRTSDLFLSAFSCQRFCFQFDSYFSTSLNDPSRLQISRFGLAPRRTLGELVV